MAPSVKEGVWHSCVGASQRLREAKAGTPAGTETNYGGKLLTGLLSVALFACFFEIESYCVGWTLPPISVVNQDNVPQYAHRTV